MADRRARRNTKIKKRPKNRSGDDSPTFKFKSTEAGSTFKCKLDHKKFHKCKSPKTYHGLDPGKHTFKVEAIDADGNVDPTPAKDKFGEFFPEIGFPRAREPTAIETGYSYGPCGLASRLRFRRPARGSPPGDSPDPSLPSA